MRAAARPADDVRPLDRERVEQGRRIGGAVRN
jgi:hypothetical protein